MVLLLAEATLPPPAVSGRGVRRSCDRGERGPRFGAGVRLGQGAILVRTTTTILQYVEKDVCKHRFIFCNEIVMPKHEDSPD